MNNSYIIERFGREARFIVVGAILTALSYYVARTFDDGIVIDKLEFAAVWTSYTCTLLCVFQRRTNYYFGIVSTFMFSVVFFEAELLALSAFNAALVMSLIYGWFRWGPDGKPLEVTDVSGMDSYAGYIGFGIFVAAAMTLLYSFFDTPLSQVDVAIATASAIAQLMLDNKKRQTWIVWAMVNVASIYLFVQQGLHLVAIQHVLFLFNTLYGWREWSKSMHHVPAR